MIHTIDIPDLALEPEESCFATASLFTGGQVNDLGANSIL
jgi:hypothetical protein